MNNTPNQLAPNPGDFPPQQGFMPGQASHELTSSLEAPASLPEADLGVGSLAAYAKNRASSQNPGYGELAKARQAHLDAILGQGTVNTEGGLHPTGSGAATQTTAYAEGGLHQTYLGSQQRRAAK